MVWLFHSQNSPMRCVFPRLQPQNKNNRLRQVNAKEVRSFKNQEKGETIKRCDRSKKKQEKGETMLANPSVAQMAVCYRGTAQTRHGQKKSSQAPIHTVRKSGQYHNRIPPKEYSTAPKDTNAVTSTGDRTKKSRRRASHRSMSSNDFSLRYRLQSRVACQAITALDNANDAHVPAWWYRLVASVRAYSISSRVARCLDSWCI